MSSLRTRLLVVTLLSTASLCAQARWRELGPAPLSGYTGRVAAIATSQSRPDLYYVAGADGGVWRTDDGGARWAPLGDLWATTAVGALALDPNDDQVLYVGTGEANFANHSRYGLGLLKSVDGGRHFQQLGESTFAGRCFARVRVVAQNPNTVFAAVTTAGGFPALAAARNHPLANGPLGIFRSLDAGASWTQLANGLPTTVSATDVAIDPNNPSVVYAAFGHVFGAAQNGIYKSSDGGQSFTKLSGGLPTGTLGRITLAIAPSLTARLYASIVNPCDAAGNNGTTLDVYRSNDGGATWSATSVGSYQATYGWYLCTSLVDRANPDLFFAGGFDLRRTTAGGGPGSWTTVTPSHVDLHALAQDAQGRLLCGSDGGLYRSTNNGTNWSSIQGNLGLIQFYAGISLQPGAPTALLGGMQDNGSGVRQSGSSWTQVLGGDGGCTAIDPTGTRRFAEYQGTGTLFRSTSGGSWNSSGTGLTGRTCFLAPYEVHPAAPLKMIYGAERVFLSNDGGSTWSAISPDLTAGGTAAIRGLAFAPSDQNMIYVSTNDGRIQTTSNGGGTWLLRRTGVPGWPRTTHPFAVHPTDSQRCWLAVGAFGTDQVLATADGGATWTASDGNLPDVPAHCVALDPREGDPMIVYVGTDQGVWRTTDLGKTWFRFGYGLPNTPIVDLRVDVLNNRLVAASQGRGAWQMGLTPRAELPTGGTGSETKR